MVFIHGGGFVTGSGGQEWYGPKILLDKDIVLITPNYRLGALGFLSTGDKVVPGNNGLKDLVQVLKCTKENIAAFGGDSDRITVSGYSAGSTAAHCLMLSPLSKDLISGAIVQSGTALSGWSFSRNNIEKNNLQGLAEFLNCTTDSNAAMIECLKKIDSDAIVKQHAKFLEWSWDPTTIFRPVIEPNLEGAFLAEHPIDIAKSGKTANVPLLTGITTEDGAYRSARYYNNPQWINDIDQDFNRVMPISLIYTTNTDTEKEYISQQLRQFYFGTKKIDNSTRDELTDLVTDLFFLMAADASVRLHAKHGSQPIFYYLFGYRGSESYVKVYTNSTYNYGVCHADDLFYLFELKNKFPNYQPDEADNKMADLLTTLVANFVRTANPTPQGDSLISAKWEPVKLDEDLNYLFIRNPNDIRMAKGFHTENVLLTLSGIPADQDVVEVQINQGVLRGKYQESRKGRYFCSFTGIPYAQPPVGELRFKPPLPGKPWKGILDATESPPVCPQRKGLEIIGDEDCLYLNVYTPQLPKTSNQLLPVMFYLHGGGMILGSSGPEWYEPNILLDQDIVLVTTNYRLGALGFLSTGDEVVPGNNALKDMVQALKWTKGNIAAFGGNPCKITIAGHSAGGAAAHYLMLSPLSRGLISGGIVQSGTAIGGWSLSRNNEEIKNMQKLAKFLNCSLDSNAATVDCIKKIDSKTIVKQDVKYLEWSIDPTLVFKPVIEPKLEGAFLTEHPANIIKSGKAANVPLLIGFSTEDGAYKSAGYYNNSQWINDIEQDFNRVISLSLGYNNKNEMEKETISNELRNFYLGNKAIDNSTKDELTDLFTDVLFLMGTDESVRLHTKHSVQPVFYYLFGYRGTESHSKLYGDSTYDYGVCHGDILLYIFELKRKFPDYKPSETDNKMTDILTTLLVDFVGTGNPNSQENIIATKWEPVELEENLNYLFIKNPNDIQMAKGLNTEQVRFLEKLNIYT